MTTTLRSMHRSDGCYAQHPHQPRPNHYTTSCNDCGGVASLRVAIYVHRQPLAGVQPRKAFPVLCMVHVTLTSSLDEFTSHSSTCSPGTPCIDRNRDVASACTVMKRCEDTVTNLFVSPSNTQPLGSTGAITVYLNGTELHKHNTKQCKHATPSQHVRFAAGASHQKAVHNHKQVHLLGGVLTAIHRANTSSQQCGAHTHTHTQIHTHHHHHTTTTTTRTHRSTEASSTPRGVCHQTARER